MDNIKAYGAGLAGGEFDHKTFIRKPNVICRIAAVVLGAGIWLCIYRGGWHREIINIHQQVCLFNGSSTTCSFISAMGFFSIMAAAGLLAADAQFDKISAVQTRSRVVRADLLVSAAFAVIFFLTFFNAALKYNRLELHEPYDGKYAKLATFFTLLSSFAWGGAAFLAWRRYQSAQAEQPFDPSYQTDFQSNFQAIPGDAQDGYGYGGNSEGIGSVGNEQTSYQMGGAPQAPPPQMAPTNPFAGQPGYQY